MKISRAGCLSCGRVSTEAISLSVDYRSGKETDLDRKKDRHGTDVHVYTGQVQQDAILCVCGVADGREAGQGRISAVNVGPLPTWAPCQRGR